MDGGRSRDRYGRLCDGRDDAHLASVHGHGTASDVNFIRVQMNYVATDNPPARLRCSTDSGTTFVDC